MATHSAESKDAMYVTVVETQNADNGHMKAEETKLGLKSSACQHMHLLGHSGFGVTELRVFGPRPMVAYVDNEHEATRLIIQMDGKVTGIYVGVQPRPLQFFEKAPNCWRPALSGQGSNCASDQDIEFITACFFDIDVVSAERTKGHPASDDELEQSHHAAQLLSRENGLAMTSTICCSGNGHYVLTPVVPIAVDEDNIATRFKHCCQQLAQGISAQVSGVRIDPVYNLSRVMRLMGTINAKGQATQARPHRRAHFVTEPMAAKSMALHHMILNTEITVPCRHTKTPPEKVRCDLAQIEKCEFVRWCRKFPQKVTEPQWFAMTTNLARLEGGVELVHEISGLDSLRYDHQQTQRFIERVLAAGYGPASCETIKGAGFGCKRLGHCQARAPMYLTALYTKYSR